MEAGLLLLLHAMTLGIVVILSTHLQRKTQCTLKECRLRQKLRWENKEIQCTGLSVLWETDSEVLRESLIILIRMKIEVFIRLMPTQVRILVVNITCATKLCLPNTI